MSAKWNRFTAVLREQTQYRILDYLFAVMFFAYLMHYQLKQIAWVSSCRIIGDVGAMLLMDLTLFIMLFYLTFFVVFRTQKLFPLFLTGALDVVVLRIWPLIDYDIRCGIINFYLLLAACGRSYETILKIVLCTLLVGLAIAVTGLAVGFTFVQEKKQLYGVGHALGYIHANNAARMLLWIGMTLWLLWPGSSTGLTVLWFGIVAVISAVYMKCRTVTLIAFFIPAANEVVRYMEKRLSEGHFRLFGHIQRFFPILTPQLCAGLSIILSYAVIPFVPLLRDRYLWNFFSRFVQNYLALEAYGIHLTGREIDIFGDIGKVFGGRMIYLRILDNAYVPWLIRNGLLLWVIVLGILSASIKKCILCRDHRLLIIFTAILIYGIMEPPALSFAYNFAFIYLLARPRECSFVPITVKEPENSSARLSV